jgi:Flp pilus assembly protein TadD
MKPLHHAVTIALASVSLVVPLAAQPSQTAAGDKPASLVQQAQQQLREGHQEQALTLARQALAESPESVAANLEVGVLLDLAGMYKQARTHFATAIDKAASPEDSARALRSMAMSYAFEGDAAGATPYESTLYERYLAAGDFNNAGAIANELARVCLESGDVGAAEAWYKKGYEAGLREPSLSEARRDLWTFRWEHAQARIAARRGDRAGAERHVAAAKAALDTGTNPDQLQFFPYLTGYVAFYEGDYAKALADLGKANQDDPFILSLMAQSLEKTGRTDRAMELYQRIMSVTSHNPTAAFARPLARSKPQGSDNRR